MFKFVKGFLKQHLKFSTAGAKTVIPVQINDGTRAHVCLTIVLPQFCRTKLSSEKVFYATAYILKNKGFLSVV